jgi:hypothetical protein
MNLLPPCSGKNSSILKIQAAILRKVVKFLPTYTAKHPRDQMLQTILPAVIFNISKEVSD